MTESEIKNMIAAQDAVNYMEQLCVLGAIIDIIDGESGNSLDCGPRLSKICNDERQKLLRKYDRCIGRLK